MENGVNKSSNKRANWSKQRYAWTTAIAIILSIIVMELIFSLTDRSESLFIRMINLFFLLGAFLWMVHDYSKQRNYNVNYLEAFKLCLTTGVYFCLLFFPLLFLALGFDHTDLHRLQLHTAFKTQQEPLAILGALFIEVPVFIAIASVAAAPLVGMNRSKKFL